MLLVGDLLDQALDVLPDGDAVVVLGRPESAPEGENHLYVYDLATGEMTRIAPDIYVAALELDVSSQRNGERSVLQFAGRRSVSDRRGEIGRVAGRSPGALADAAPPGHRCRT